jgi:hypothetical protein
LVLFFKKEQLSSPWKPKQKNVFLFEKKKQKTLAPAPASPDACVRQLRGRLSGTLNVLK